jgi:RNA polymerase sigma-70 factor (ECF subfamily)
MSEAFADSLRRWTHTLVGLGWSICDGGCGAERPAAGQRRRARRAHPRGSADAEETVQEVFINVFSCLESYRREAPLGAWILGIARRVVASRFKKKRHPTIPLAREEELESVDLPMPLLQRTATPFEYYECHERILQLEAAAARRLTREQRRLFELHHLHHRSITDIATQLDKSEDAVKSNLYRARKALLAR